MPRPVSRRERTADAAVHVAGLALGAAGCLVLAAAVPHADIRRAVALAPYAAGLLLMLTCSALYNLSPDGAPRKSVLRRFDHAAIFAMIAGTYTPVALLGIGGAWGWGLLAGVWVGAGAGAALDLLGSGRSRRLSVVVHLLLGWSGVLALRPLIETLAGSDLVLLAAGGLLYSLGVVFHLWERLPYHDAVWHAFVLAAAGCHYGVVLRLATSAE